MNLAEPLKKPIRQRDQQTKIGMLQQFMRREHTKVNTRPLFPLYLEMIIYRFFLERILL